MIIFKAKQFYAKDKYNKIDNFFSKFKCKFNLQVNKKLLKIL